MRRATRAVGVYANRLPSQRGVALTLVLLLLVAAGLADRRGTARQPTLASQVLTRSAMGVPPANATSSAWYCALVGASHSLPQPGQVEVVNMGDHVRTGQALIFAPGTLPVTQALTVAPRSRISIHPRDFLDAPYASVLVHLDGGDIAVEHSVVATSAGESFSPCASGAAIRWDFADGSTSDGTTSDGTNTVLGLFNPFPDDAIADLNLSTNTGSAVSDGLQAIVVPANTTMVVNLGNYVKQRQWVAGTVNVRSGRLVVDQVVQSGNGGTALALATASLSPSWYFSDIDASATPGVLALFNPRSTDTSVQVRTFVAGASPSAPFLVYVNRQSQATIDLAQDVRLPKGTRFGLEVRAVAGTAGTIVAQRNVQNVTQRNAGDLTGVTTTAQHWVVVPDASRIAVVNPGTKPTDLHLTAVANGTVTPMGQTIHLAAGRRVELPSGPGSSLEVAADQPVAVSSDLTAAIPLP